MNTRNMKNDSSALPASEKIAHHITTVLGIIGRKKDELAHRALYEMRRDTPKQYTRGPDRSRGRPGGYSEYEEDYRNRRATRGERVSVYDEIGSALTEIAVIIGPSSGKILTGDMQAVLRAYDEGLVIELYDALSRIETTLLLVQEVSLLMKVEAEEKNSQQTK